MKHLTNKIIVLMVAIVLSATMLLFFVSSNTEVQYSDDTNTTKDLLAASDAINVEELESLVILTQDSLNIPKGDEKSAIKYKFLNAMVIGDSIAEGLLGYGMIDARNCIGRRGARIDTIDDTYDVLFSRKPDVLFLEFGMNDLEYWRGDAQRYYDVYVEKVTRIQQELPDTKIYINAILPIDSSTIANNPIYGSYTEFNAKLRQLCEEMNCTYIDNSALLNRMSIQYEFDGIHPRYDYYFMWAENMANIAGL